MTVNHCLTYARPSRRNAASVNTCIPCLMIELSHREAVVSDYIARVFGVSAILLDIQTEHVLRSI